jgi:cell division protein FtsX
MLLVLGMPVSMPLLLLLLLLLLMMSLSHVPSGWQENLSCKVLLQQVRRDGDSMVLGVRRGHGGAVGLS